jgi:isoamylase
MSEQDWESGFGRSIMVFLNGEGITDLDRRGERVEDASFLLCFNAHDEAIQVTVPDPSYGKEWAVVLDTTAGEVVDGDVPDDVRIVAASGHVPVAARSLVVLRRLENGA